MHTRHDLSPELRAEVRRRGGVVHLDDLRADGVGRAAIQRLSGTELEPLGAGWFALGHVTWDGHLHAATAMAGGRGVASGSTAAALYGLLPRELPIELSCTPSGPRSREWVRFARIAQEHRWVTTALDPPRIGLEDTVLDVILTLGDDDRIAFLTRVLQERRTTAPRLLARLRERRRYSGRALVVDVLSDAAGIESVLEHSYRERVERRHDLPPMQRQFVVPGSGHRADGAYPERRVLIGLDGAAYHDPVRDRALDNLHLSLGWSTLRFGWTDARLRPCSTAETVAAIHAIPLPRCSGCRPRPASS